jgi:hypothetical protein
LCRASKVVIGSAVNGQDADALLAAWAREESHDTECRPPSCASARTFRIQLRCAASTRRTAWKWPPGAKPRARS